MNEFLDTAWWLARGLWWLWVFATALVVAGLIIGICYDGLAGLRDVVDRLRAEEDAQTAADFGESPMAPETEDDLWDQFWDTDAARCCSCPSCNYYAPDYEQHRNEPCILRTLIERIIVARSVGAS